MIEKSANQLWRESGTTIQKTLGDIKKEVGYKTESSGKSVFGINKTIIILVGVGALAFVTYKFIKARK